MLKLRNKYFILRHGQTIFQTKKKEFIYPWPEKPPVHLTKEGERQVRASVKKLKKQKINLIFSSDIYRTRQTAGIAAKELGLKVIFDKRLRDINLGVYRGRAKEGYRQYFRYTKERFYKRPKNGENWNDLEKRMTNFIKEIDKKYKNKKILIVSHGDPLMILMKAVKGITDKELLKNKQKIFLKTGGFKKI